MSDARGVWTPDMGEISGFGGGYEEACRAMVRAGLAWFDEHPDADPHYKGFKNVYGVLADDNGDAKALDKAMVAAAEPLGGCTGAMHQATANHVFAVRRLGWPEYCRQLREREIEEAQEKSRG